MMFEEATLVIEKEKDNEYIPLKNVNIDIDYSHKSARNNILYGKREVQIRGEENE